MMKTPALLPALVLLLPALSCAEPLARVTFIPQWVPQAQFAGYYVACDKGIYARHGLDVTVLRGGPESPPSELLERGAAHFGTMFLTTGIIKRASGVPVVNIAQVVQRSSFMLVAKKSSGILKPADMNNRTVGVWGPEFQALAGIFFRRHGLSVTTVPQSATLNLFFMDGVAVASAMLYNEYHTMLNAGYDPEELSVFSFHDLGIDVPEDGIYCLEATYRTDPERCRRFASASLEGWTYAFDHPEEALDIVLRHSSAAHVATNRVHQRWMLHRMRDLIASPGSRLAPGILSETAFADVVAELRTGGLIGSTPAFSEFFVGCRLP